MGTAKINKVSVQDYLAMLSKTDAKLEYHDGYIFNPNIENMAGGTPNHGFICANIIYSIKSEIKSKNLKCNIGSSDLKLYIPAFNTFYFPDAMMVCDPIQTDEKDENAIVNPTLIVEVLSKSTGMRDRGEKFMKYRSIRSLTEYIVIEQDKILVDIYFKNNAGNWELRSYNNINEKITLPISKLEIDLSDIYSNIEINSLYLS